MNREEFIQRYTRQGYQTNDKHQGELIYDLFESLRGKDSSSSSSPPQWMPYPGEKVRILKIKPNGSGFAIGTVATFEAYEPELPYAYWVREGSHRIGYSLDCFARLDWRDNELEQCEYREAKLKKQLQERDKSVEAFRDAARNLEKRCEELQREIVRRQEPKEWEPTLEDYAKIIKDRPGTMGESITKRGYQVGDIVRFSSIEHTHGTPEGTRPKYFIRKQCASDTQMPLDCLERADAKDEIIQERVKQVENLLKKLDETHQRVNSLEVQLANIRMAAAPLRT